MVALSRFNSSANAQSPRQVIINLLLITCIGLLLYFAVNWIGLYAGWIEPVAHYEIWEAPHNLLGEAEVGFWLSAALVFTSLGIKNIDRERPTAFAWFMILMVLAFAVFYYRLFMLHL